MTDLHADYYPERWMILKIIEANNNTHYRVFASWGGSYLSGQSWKMNSGIVSVDEDDIYLYFKGSSGSVYACRKTNTYGAFSFALMTLHNMIEEARGKIEIIEMPENINWKGLKYE